MRRHVIVTAIAASALLCLGQATAFGADDSNAASQAAAGSMAPSGAAAAVALLEGIKAQYRQGYAALVDQNDPAAAAKVLAKLEPEAKRVVALLKGTEVGQQAAAGLSQLGEVRRMLAAGETEDAKKLLEDLGQLGGELEPKIRDLAAEANAASGAKVIREAHAEVTAIGIGEAYAKAIARTVEAARAVATEQFGFDMPEVVYVSVSASPAAATRLFNDGQDHITLSIPSEDKLQRPAVTGVFNLYGFCHEIGHMAMYRVIHQRSWLSSAGAEGWAHYAGSRIVDGVYAHEGEKLWPDAYNYLEDGTARLRKQLAASNPNPTTQAAGLWQSLTEIVGDKGVAPVFAAWAKVQVEESRPGVALGQALMAHGDREKLEVWWRKAQPVLLVAQAKSSFAARSQDAAQLKGPRKELASDDGTSAGKLSSAGSGHAVRFEAPGKDCYLTAVRIYGSRYGQSQPPRENASIWLCDTSFKKIAEFPCPYYFFQRGAPRWVTVPVKATLVPAEFIICVGFNPTATKGVFVHYDGAGGGSSFMGLPGNKGRPFGKGDWMIRATVQEAVPGS